jgi:hypothetical protein
MCGAFKVSLPVELCCFFKTDSEIYIIRVSLPYRYICS